MKLPLLVLSMAFCGSAFAQGPRPTDLGAVDLPVGEQSVAWYTTWETAAAEAKRSNRPIFFFAAAAQCRTVSGTFWPGYKGSEIRLISTKEFIEASKKFVCVRLDTYESKETQERIRDLLDGTMQNTAFVIYAPDGKTKLTRSGRAPELVFGRGRLASRNGSSNEEVINGMEKIAAKYEMKGDLTQAELQDFDSFKQSLNIASSDQKLLVFTVAPRAKLPAVEKVLTEVANDAEVHGRFHFDTAGKPDVKWAEKVTKEKNKTGVFVIRSGQFGQEGYVMTEFPLDVTVESLKAGLLAANETFAKLEERKHYGDHVSDGRRKGIKFDSNVEAGEDRDGDGKIDEQKRRGKRGERGERRGPPRGRRGPPPEHEDGSTSDLMDFLDL